MPGTERRRWTPQAGSYGGRASRRSFDYEAFVPDEIAELDLSLPGDVAGILTEADVAIRELNRASPSLGVLETLARQLLRAEALASSRIEGLEMSHRRLARAAFAPDEADQNAKLVLGNLRAMEEAIALGSSREALTVARVKALHRRIFSGTSLDWMAGQLRTSQNWIGGAADSPRGAEFVPPNERRVPELLDDLCTFSGRDDLPAVAQAAIVHAQFETIHPFGDGNGRVGRCLIHVILRRRGVAPTYVPPISLILATDQAAYLRGLTSFRDYDAAAIADWVGTFAQAARSAAREALGFAARIAELQERWLARAGVRRRGTTVERLIGSLPGRPIVDVKSAAEVAGVVYESARAAVDQLEAAGILRAIGSRRRDRVFEAPDLFDLVNAFERHLATPPGSPRPLRPVPRRAGRRQERPVP